MNIQKLGLGRSLVVASVFLSLTGAAWAHGKVVSVDPPNGFDDTAILQAALNECVGVPNKCIVQLAAGEYKTAQLLTFGFRGELKGMGQELTSILALPDLVSAPLQDGNIPPSPESPWPDLIIFVDGNISISDLSVKNLNAPGMQPYDLGGGWWTTSMLSLVRIMAKDGPMKVVVNNVAIEGVNDWTELSLFGWNVVNGLIVAGEYPTEVITGNWPDDRILLEGSVSVTDSDFASVLSGSAMSHFNSAKVTIKGNTFDNVALGPEIAHMEDSIVKIANNSVSAWWNGVILYNPYYNVTEASRFLVLNNDIQIAGEWSAGIGQFDNWDGTASQHVTITGNHIDVAEGALGIFMSPSNGTLAAANVIAGQGFTGIFADASSECSLLGNDVSDFTGDVGPKIWLTGSSSNCLVAGSYEEGDVLDEGVNNVVLGF